MTDMTQNEKALAIHQGQALCNYNLPPWPTFETDEIRAVSSILSSGNVNYWTGRECVSFEREFADYIGTDYAIALANGTVGLELALRALDIGPGDEVVVPSRSFIASASCVVAVGATPVFADIDRDSGNITVDAVSNVISARTKALIAVHLGGWPCDINRIIEFARNQGLYVIEDCAQAHGASVNSKRVGSFGDCAVFSFCQDKIMTTGGEGGMLVTSDVAVWERAWSYKDHGKNFHAVTEKPVNPGFRWVHHSFGSNYRMTEMQAAIGRKQLQKLEGWLEKRKNNAHRLGEQLEALELLRIPVSGPDLKHAYYKFYCYIVPEKLKSGWNRDRILAAIIAEGVPCFTGSCSEIYREKAFVNAGLGRSEPLPVAHELGETSLMFLVHPTLTDKDMDCMASAIKKVVRCATR